MGHAASGNSSAIQLSSDALRGDLSRERIEISMWKKMPFLDKCVRVFSRCVGSSNLNSREIGTVVLRFDRFVKLEENNSIFNMG